jgi:hypothetical protein
MKSSIAHLLRGKFETQRHWTFPAASLFAVYLWTRGAFFAILSTKKFMNGEKLNTGQKALQINLDAKKYGTFAEIGAGQEVARWFFHVGKASGTVAKTISAYDMAVSDAIYGRPTVTSAASVCRRCLITNSTCCSSGSTRRAATNALFRFRRHRRHASRDEGQGWLGIKFQTFIRTSEPSTIIIHVRTLDKESLRQQEALGIIGVNFIHGAFYLHDEPAKLIGSLMDDLSSERIEVDMIKFSGPAFTGVDNRLMALQLVQQWLTEAAMFTADGETVIPGELLWKKPVLLERGSFRPLTNPMLDMLERAQEQFVRTNRACRAIRPSSCSR